MKLSIVATTACVATFMYGAASADTLYSSELNFNSAISNPITDNYTNPGYQFIQSDAAMTAVLGQTSYETTGFSDLNIVENQYNVYYCAGCNGSFKLGFASTSDSTAGGVYGVGLNYYGDGSFTAFVRDTDGSATDYAIPGSGFFGITSDAGIASIHFGYSDAPTTSGYFAVTSLTVGAPGAAATSGMPAGVPEPASWAMMLVGFGVVGAGMRRASRARAMVA